MNVVHEKSKLALSGFYLTLVSIMQSLALGYLLQVLGSKLIDTGTLPANTLLQAAIALLAIILVWHEYAIGTIAYTWELDLFDSVIPYLIGITEAFIIGSMALDEQKRVLGATPYTLWLWSIVTYVIAGILAHVNQNKKAKKEPETQTPVVNRFHKIGLKTTLYSIGYCVFFVVLASIYSFYDLSRFQRMISLLIVTMFVFELTRINKNYNDAQRADSEQTS